MNRGPRRWPRWPLVVPGIVLMTAGRAGAQHAPRTAGAITGVVFDSLDAKPLGAASVFLIGTQLSVTTNSQGRFAFDSVPAGAYRVGFESPDLDAIGLTPNPQSVAVRAGVVDTVALFVPSVTTLLDAMCPASRAAGGESILLGSVSDAATGAPVASATVTLSWQDVSVERKKVVEQHHVVPATTSADGSYAVCGVPGDVLVMVRATASRRASGVLWVLVAPRRLVRMDVAVALDAERTATLTGVVADTAGHPLADAEVEIVGVPGGTHTDENGRFRLATLPAGSRDAPLTVLGSRARGYLSGGVLRRRRTVRHAEQSGRVLPPRRHRGDRGIRRRLDDPTRVQVGVVVVRGGGDLDQARDQLTAR